MKSSISKSEKLDVFIALASIYGFEFDSVNIENNHSVSKKISLESLSGIDKEDLNLLNEKILKFQSLPRDKQQNWQQFWIDKLRNRGRTRRLDESIHVEMIVKVLSVEPKIIQQLIFDNLPGNLAKKVLQEFPEFRVFKKNTKRLTLPNEKASEIIRDKFLSNFVAYEDLYETQIIDSLTLEDIDDLVWKLGIREIAINCRGIKTKENLAIFLKPFDDDTTREIALTIAKLEDINPNRVLKAEKIVRSVLDEKNDSRLWVKNIGLKLLAMALHRRDDDAKKFTMQKLPIKDGARLIYFGNQLNQMFDQPFGDINLEIEILANEIIGK